MENAHGRFLKANSHWFCFYDIDHNLIRSDYKGGQHVSCNWLSKQRGNGSSKYIDCL